MGTSRSKSGLNAMFALATMLALGAASCGPKKEDDLLGRWQGQESNITIAELFRKDHTFRFQDIYAGGLRIIWEGTWSTTDNIVTSKITSATAEGIDPASVAGAKAWAQQAVGNVSASTFVVYRGQLTLVTNGKERVFDKMPDAGDLQN